MARRARDAQRFRRNLRLTDVIENPRVGLDALPRPLARFLTVIRRYHGALPACITAQSLGVDDVLAPKLLHGVDDLAGRFAARPDTEVIGRNMNIRKPLGDRRDLAVPLNLQGFVSEGR